MLRPHLHQGLSLRAPQGAQGDFVLPFQTFRELRGFCAPFPNPQSARGHLVLPSQTLGEFGDDLVLLFQTLSELRVTSCSFSKLSEIPGVFMLLLQALRELRATLCSFSKPFHNPMAGVSSSGQLDVYYLCR